MCSRWHQRAIALFVRNIPPRPRYSRSATRLAARCTPGVTARAGSLRAPAPVGATARGTSGPLVAGGLTRGRAVVGGDRRPLGLGAVAATLTALIALGALLRFWGLGHQGLWFDEANTALLVRFSPSRMLGLLPQSESTPPLYYCVAWVWVRIFGHDAAGLRSLSAVAGVLVIPVAYGAAAELARSRRAGLVCAALTACNPLLVWYSQEARSYELLVLLCALSLLAFARVRRDPTPRRVVLWVIAGALALATHYFAALVVVPEAAWLALAHRRRRGVLAGVVIAAACGAALVPLAISQNGTGNDSWIAHSPLSERLAQVVAQLLIGTDAPARVPLKLAAIALALVGLALVALARADARRGAVVAGGVALTGLAIALVLIPAGFDDLITRNIIELCLPAAIAVSVGLAAAGARRAGLAVTAALCAIGLVAVVGIAVEPRFQRPDWPGVVRTIGAQPPPGQARAVLIQRYRTLLPLSLYLPGLHVLRGPARVTQLDVIAMHSPSQPLCWWGAECNLISSRMQRRYPIADPRPAGDRRVRQFQIERLQARRPLLVTPAAVSRALSATRLRQDVLMVQRRA